MYVMSSKIFEKSRPTEKLGEQSVLLAPPITLLGEQLLRLLPLFPRLWFSVNYCNLCRKFTIPAKKITYSILKSIFDITIIGLSSSVITEQRC